MYALDSLSTLRRVERRRLAEYMVQERATELVAGMLAVERSLAKVQAELKVCTRAGSGFVLCWCIGSECHSDFHSDLCGVMWAPSVGPAVCLDQTSGMEGGACTPEA